MEELLDYTEKLLDPSLVLLDRGFYSVEAIRESKSRKIGPIMPANKTRPVKKICKKFKKGKEAAEISYTIKGSKGEGNVRLLLTEKKTGNETEIHPFIPNMSIDPNEASENYSWWWRIGTNIGELEKFKPFTTSRSMELRRLYFLVSMMLYNLWILTCNGEELPRTHEFKKQLKLLLKILQVFRKEKSRPPPVTTLEKTIQIREDLKNTTPEPATYMDEKPQNIARKPSRLPKMTES